MAPSNTLVHPDVLTLAELLRAEWPAARERIRLSGHPTCEGDAEDENDAAKDTDADNDAVEDQDDDAAAADGDKEPDWKRMARKHEREAKAARKREADLQKQLAAREDADKTEHEKAIAAARTETAAQITTKFEAAQRTDRIENAVTKLSLKGFKIKDSAGKTVTVRFADPDDAQLRIDRALHTGDLDVDDIYTDGKVQTPALTAFLAELLDEHPRLRADNDAKDDVDMDGGKGSGAGSKTLEDLSPDDHLKAIQGRA